MKQFKRFFSKLLVLAVSLCICFTAVAGSAPLSVNAASGALKVPSDFYWGVNGHADVAYCPVYKTRNMPEQIKLVAELGCNMYRTGSELKSALDYERLDAVVYEAAKYGIDILFTIGNCNPVVVKALATRYDGKHGHGRIKYFQIHNETSGHFVTNWDEGHKREGYDMEKMKPYIDMFKECAAALREAQPDCKIIINSASFSYFYFQILIEQGVDFDIIGYDWYSRDEKVLPFAPDHENGVDTFEELLDYLCSFKKEVIICEINDFPMFNTSVESKKETIDRINTQNTYLPDVTKRVAAYANKNPLLKGMVIYELLDESFDDYPADSDNIDGEAHFGLVYTKNNGDILDPKPVYWEMQKLFGGGKVTPVTPNFSLDGDTSSESQTVTSSQQEITSETESAVSSENTEIVVEPVDTETDQESKKDKTDKNNKKEEKIESSFPIVPVAAGGGVALVAILVGVFLLLKFKFGMFGGKPANKSNE